MNEILKKIKNNVDLYPERIAYKNEYESITYKDLWLKASHYSKCLINQGSKPVVLYGNKEIFMIIGMLSCLLAKRAYVPIDISCPKERIKKIIDICKAELILTNYELRINNSYSLEELDQFKEIKTISSNKTAYIIFTSGSTGDPKGVPISYSNLLNFCNWISDIHPLSGYNDSVIFNQSNYSFDLSVASIYYGLLNAHTIVSYNNSDFIDQIDYCIKDNVEIMVATPTYINLCLLGGNFNTNIIKTLKCIYCCGEKLDNSTAKKVLKQFPNLCLINAYGPSEATSAVTAVLITKDMINKELPIGDIKNSACEIKILEDEIILYGKSVFDGYINYQNDCFINIEEKEFYKTGDIGKIVNNKLYFIDRKDRQIKYKGYRIVLDDIESHIKSISNIDDAVVLTKKEKDIVIMIYAYCTSKSKINEKHIKEQLSKKLPKYMIPKKIIQIDEMPMTNNGKIDRKVLEKYGKH